MTDINEYCDAFEAVDLSFLDYNSKHSDTLSVETFFKTHGLFMARVTAQSVNMNDRMQNAEKFRLFAIAFATYTKCCELSRRPVKRTNAC